MEEITSYKTLSGRSEGMYKEKGSKFIGIAVPCFSEAEAKAYLENWKKEHHQARHLCYAYRFGADKSVFRANDDGEPNNSAGAPILGQIQSFDLTNVLVGVVRYYGGTKLGVGGLINAYRTAAQEAIEAGKVVERTLHSFLELQFGYDIMPHLMNLVKENDWQIDQQVFEESCLLEIQVPLENTSFAIDLIEKTGKVEIINKGVF